MLQLHNLLTSLFIIQGEVIADFMQYFNLGCYSEKECGDARVQCILVDNTKCKCECAAGGTVSVESLVLKLAQSLLFSFLITPYIHNPESFLKVGGTWNMDLHCIHYTEAENALCFQEVLYYYLKHLELTEPR